MQRFKSSGCTPAAQPPPNSSSIRRPVKFSHPRLKKVQSLSVPDIQINVGVVSAVTRKRSSLSRSSASCPLRSSKRKARRIKGTVVNNRNSCKEKTRLTGSVSVKGPWPCSAPQMDKRARMLAEVAAPVDPKRKADQSKNGTKE